MEGVVGEVVSESEIESMLTLRLDASTISYDFFHLDFKRPYILLISVNKLSSVGFSFNVILLESQ